MIILNDKQINQKLKRLAFEIIEQNSSESEIILAGVNNNGFEFAKFLKSELDQIEGCDVIFTLANIKLNPAQPVQSEISIDLDDSYVSDKVVIVIDDVANTGRTLFYACLPFTKTIVKKLQTAVLVDRTHKSFPVMVNFVGLSLATTVNNHIDVALNQAGQFETRLI